MSNRKINKDILLNVLEANRFLSYMLQRDGGSYNSMVITNEGVQYTNQDPQNGSKKPGEVKSLLVTFDEINEHLELEA